MKNPLTIIMLCFLMMGAPCALFSQEVEPFETFTQDKAGYQIRIPAGTTERSADSGRMLWTYQPSSSSSPLTIRINHVFVGVSVDHGEYMNILEETKRNEGMDIRRAEIRNGKGFIYESKIRKSDDEQDAFCLIALSEKGWICTVTVSGKGIVLKKEMTVIRSMMDSFEFIAGRKAK